MIDNVEVKTKRCCKCGRVLPLADFNKRKSSKDGLQPYCKQCNKAMHAEWYAHNKEAVADYQAQYRQANKGKIAEYNAAYKQANKGKIAEYNAAYYQANKGKFAEYNATYYQENKDAIRKQKAEYYQANKGKIAEYNADYSDPQTHPMNWARKMVNAYRQMDREKGFDPSQTITAEWFLDNIAYKPCAHCGLTHFGSIGCNRLDNTKGHTIDNVESCCFKCNCKDNIRDQLARGVHVSCKGKARHKTA